MNGPFFCKCDADLFIHPQAIFDGFERLKSNPNNGFVFPYNGVSFTIKSPLREELMESYNFGKLPFVKLEQADHFNFPSLTLKNSHSVGLIHHFRTSVFKELGGYNEEFVGWGYEDNEVTARFKILGHPRDLLENYNAFHLYHPRKRGDKTQIINNYLKWQFVESLSPTLLKEYIKTWSRFYIPK